MATRATTFAGLRDGFGNFHQVLAEIKPRQRLTGTWTVDGVYTNTYYIGVTQYTDAHGKRTPSAVQADNTTLTERASVALVDANAGSWYFDSALSRLYVRLNPTADPTYNHTLTFDFWLYCANGSETPGVPTTFNGRDYRPILMSAPVLVREANEQLWGTPLTSTGTLVLANPTPIAARAELGARAFDRLFDLYIWIGAEVRVLFGGDDLPYAQFQRVWTGRVQTASWSNAGIELQCYDAGEDLNRQLTLTTITTATYANAEAAAMGRVIPICYGAFRNLRAWCTDTTTLEYTFANHATAIVDSIRVGTDEVFPYSLNLSGATSTFRLPEYVRSRVIDGLEAVAVDGVGRLDASSDPMTNPSDVASDVLTSWGGKVSGDLDSSSFATSRKKTAPFHLSLVVAEPTSVRAVLDRICRSCLGYFYVDANGLYVMDAWTPVRTDVSGTRTLAEAMGTITGLVSRVEQDRCFSGYQIEAAKENAEAQGSTATQGRSAVLIRTDTTASQLTRSVKTVRISDTALENTLCADVLGQRLGLLFGLPNQRFEFVTNKRTFDLTVNSVVKLTKKVAPDSSNSGFSSRVARVLRTEFDPRTALGRILLEDLSGWVAVNYGTWKAGGTPTWAAASAAQRAAGGFWTDGDGRADGADVTSTGYTRWA